MKILVVGAGSIGVYLGVMLNRKKHDVVLLGRKKLKKLHDTILIGDLVYSVPKRIYLFPKRKQYDFIFVTSKLYDLRGNLKKINDNKIRSKYLLSIQNGIVDNDEYEEYISNFKFSSISVFEGFRVVENQLIVSPSKSGWKTDSSRTGKETSRLLRDAGINCLPEKNLDSIKAEKTIMNCCVNILSATRKKTFFELYGDKRTKRLMDAVFDESYAVLSEEYDLRPKEKLRKLFYQVIKPMKHYSSTYQDAISGRKSEVRFINGLIVKLARKYKLSAKLNQQLLSEFYKKYPKSR